METLIKRRIHYLQHVPFEGLGYIEAWAEQRGYALSVTKMYEPHSFPPLADFDMLVIMGGPMGTYEEDKYPWLVEEKTFVRTVIDSEKPVVGICLGSQVIANALGAAVYPNKEKEIGWMPINLTDEAVALFDAASSSPIIFQWHGDTFDLPQGATLLASSDVCPNQAFRYKENVLALQFHFEVTEYSTLQMLDNGLDELVDSPHIQKEEYIRTNMHHIPLCNRMIESALDKLIKTIE